ncbi:MAG: hypothetical protein M5R36_17050 [Deltaproteobacteria bacterium]|nr:hypothetical protein [Deltaproteobacteria bacterium]
MDPKTWAAVALAALLSTAVTTLSIAQVPECANDAQCEDGIPCTVNTCELPPGQCATQNNCGTITVAPECPPLPWAEAFSVPIVISNASGVDALGVTFDFDHDALSYAGFTLAGTLLDGHGSFINCGLEGSGAVGCSANPYPPLGEGSSGPLFFSSSRRSANR